MPAPPASRRRVECGAGRRGRGHITGRGRTALYDGRRSGNATAIPSRSTPSAASVVEAGVRPRGLHLDDPVLLRDPGGQPPTPDASGVDPAHLRPDDEPPARPVS